MAFPASDPSNPSIESDIPPPTDADLRHQLQLQSGFGAGAAGAGGWTFVPRISSQEMYTDNVLQTATDRRWDLVTLFTPGFSLLGDVPNAQVKLRLWTAIAGGPPHTARGRRHPAVARHRPVHPRAG